MKTSPVLLVGLDSVAQAAVSRAVRVAFPAASVTVVGSIDEAVQAGVPGGADLLILAQDRLAEVSAATAMLDHTGLPRWAVAVFGRQDAGSENDEVLQSAATPEAMAEMLKSVLKLHRLRRENARLRGDLHTVASRVNHDLRTPLSPIYTSCEVLKLTLGAQAAAHAPVIQSITSSVDELTQLIDRVSFVLKASISPKPKTRVAMAETVFTAMGRLESKTLAAKATVTQAKSWPDVQGVSPWLEMMMWQLLANALQHSGPTPRVELGWKEDPAEYRFWVQNSGKEIPPERRARLFQPFHQLHQTNAARGLGLSIVQRLAELQGGHCGYEPLGADGSRFFFALPK